MHCTQADCIGCFGAGCYVVGQNGQCYTIVGSYCGDCHECYEENVSSKSRPRRKGQCTGNCMSCHGQCINVLGQTFSCDENCSCQSYYVVVGPVGGIISDTCNGQNLSCDENCSCNSYDNIISDTCNMAGGMLYGGGGMNNNVRSRRTSSRLNDSRVSGMGNNGRPGITSSQRRAGGRNPMRKTNTPNRLRSRRDNVAHISEGIKPSPPNISAPRPGNVKQACDSWCQVYTVPGYVSAQAFTSSCGGICDKDYSKMYVCNCVISPVYENLFDNDPYMAGYEIDAGDCKGNYTFRLDGYSFGNGNFHEGGNALHTSDTPYGDGYQSNILCDRQALMDYDASCPGPYHMSCNTNEDCAQYDYLGGNVFGNDSCFGEDCMVCDSGCCNCGCV